MKVDRSRIAEALRIQGLDREADDALASLPPLVDTERDATALTGLGLDVDRLLDILGPGGLGKMIGG